MLALIVIPLTTFIITLLICLIPRFIRNYAAFKRGFDYLTILAAGFLLALMLTDFIPHIFMHKLCESEPTHSDHHGHSIPIAMFISGLTFILLLAIDVVLLRHSHCDNQSKVSDHNQHSHDKFGSCSVDKLKHTKSRLQALIFIIALSIHSFFESLMFKFNDSNGLYGLSQFEWGILMHKILEAFALGIGVFSTSFEDLYAICFIVIYSGLTPLGMFIGHTMTKVNPMIEEVFNGLALGSVIFIVFVEMIPPNFHSLKSQKSRIALLTLGYMIPVLICLISNI